VSAGDKCMNFMCSLTSGLNISLCMVLYLLASNDCRWD